MRVRKSRVSAKCTPGLLPLKGSDELRGLKRKGSDEHRAPAENHAFGFSEKIVAPVEHDAYPQTPIDRHPRSTDVAALPLANGYAERLVGSIRRECLDHVIV